MHQVYRYVGPEHIRAAVEGMAPGVAVRSERDLAEWADRQTEWRNGELIATYVVLVGGLLQLAPRRCEHVACAAGQEVWAAGELTLCRQPELAIVAISNLSTGYCPQPACWSALEASLHALDIEYPDQLTASFEFRLCPGCGQRNLIKDEWYECASCESPLPRTWNFHAPRASSEDPQMR